MRRKKAGESSGLVYHHTMLKRLIPIAFLLTLGSASHAGDTGQGFGPSSREAFERWANINNAHLAAYVKFNNYLVDQGVQGIVPSWQLLRVDADYAVRCGSSHFAVPPETTWPQIVPTLRLLREHVVPVTGKLQVVSAWRSPEINSCVKGAKRSRHLEFRALDLVAELSDDRVGLFADLCRMHRRAGHASKMGLGAYYAPEMPAWNARGRFHIDAAGFRAWGPDYTQRSNPCPGLLS